eukprot:CAMPEP_0206589660 /NCGR_PEP_ID=MMETSP0325_2-20121206/39071_1 /ASSEMBLY_ACC=CAM_ASM_000347 /TAXON_ID=2866 /ORGANISM="Crypthecodinium cohnii, Strain Seligo" /LENGTH=401 /DNA_ID=CAMNT_0054098293 /DNA_START=86 /DNA_END=1291 /DNA_ORIENTATION=+
MSKVTALVYDITGGMAKAMSMMLVGKQIDVVPHTGIVAFGNEYFFGAGPCVGVPRQSVPAQVAMEYDLGETTKTREELESYINSHLAKEHTQENYSLLTHNCNHYADDVAKFLMNGKGVPDWILNIANDALSTEKGSALRGMIEQADQMMRQQSGGGGSGGLNPYANVTTAGSSASPAPAPAAAAHSNSDELELLQDAFKELATAPVEDRRTCLSTFSRMTANVEANPIDPKYRRVREGNAAFNKKVLKCPGGETLMLAAGWVPGEHEGDSVWEMEQDKTPIQGEIRKRLEAELAKLPAPAPKAVAPAPAPTPAAAPDLGGMGGLGGMNPQMMQQMMNNPAMMSQAQQMMNNPQMMQQAQQMMNNPQMMQQVQQMMNNPQMMQQMQNMMGGGGFGGPGGGF